jgi:hypothetical protein
MEALCTANRSKELVIAKLRHEKAGLEARLGASQTNSAKPVPGILRVDLTTNKQEDEDILSKLQQENTVLRTKIDQLVCQSEGLRPPLNDPAISASTPPVRSS